jgi:hypothetical protein
MTQYDDLIAKKKEELAAEAWGKKVKYIHASNGVMEVAYNNGLIEFERTATGEKWTEGEIEKEENLLHSFSKWLTDNSGE